MAIKGNKTTCGFDIETLPLGSHKEIIKICDVCSKESLARIKDIYISRRKRKSDKDYCRFCGHGAKVSKPRKGKRLMGDGYYGIQHNGKEMLEHRVIMSQYIGRDLTELERVHHINGNKKDNSILNLFLCENVQKHNYVHNSLEAIAYQLIKDGKILFDSKLGQYYINTSFNNDFEISLGFEHIAIQQQKNICNSRLEANIESEIIKGVFRPIPLIASNMSTVINASFYKKLYKLGAFGVLHRADTKENILASIRDVAQECQWVAASIGIEADQFEFAQEMIKNGCNIIVIDVAHGYSDNIINLAKKIKLHNSDARVVIGNTTTIDLLLETYEFVDGIKSGIANGLACETKNTAGCNEKQFSTVLKFKELSKKFGIPIISDGGIREPADFTKAIAAGANSVMAGSIFAACPESAAELIQYNDKPKKVYAGMASEYVQNVWKGGLKPGTVAEGGIRYLDPGEPLESLINKYSGALRSGITYAGAKDIKSFQENVKFVRVM
jgi:IMP dehydrogenase